MVCISDASSFFRYLIDVAIPLSPLHEAALLLCHHAELHVYLLSCCSAYLRSAFFYFKASWWWNSFPQDLSPSIRDFSTWLILHFLCIMVIVKMVYVAMSVCVVISLQYVDCFVNVFYLLLYAYSLRCIYFILYWRITIS